MAGYLEVPPWINMYSAWVNLLVEQNFLDTDRFEQLPIPPFRHFTNYPSGASCDALNPLVLISIILALTCAPVVTMFVSPNKTS
jgi:hypothetical protein